MGRGGDGGRWGEREMREEEMGGGEDGERMKGRWGEPRGDGGQEMEGGREGMGEDLREQMGQICHEATACVT